MKHYFLVAKDVGDLTGIFCSALEMQQLKALPAPRHAARAVQLAPPRQAPAHIRLPHRHGRSDVADKDVFASDPVNFIRLFAFADEHRLTFHPEALRLVRANRSA